MFKSIKIKGLFLFVAIVGSVGLTAQENKISDDELNKFAEAYINVQMQNQESQQKMMVAIEEEGLKVDRFSEIQESTMNPNVKSDATEAELKMHANATAKIEGMQPEFEKKAREGIESKG